MSPAPRRREVVGWIIAVVALAVVVTAAALAHRASRESQPRPTPAATAGPVSGLDCRQGTVPRIVGQGGVVTVAGVRAQLAASWREPLSAEQWPWLDSVAGAQQRLGPPEQRWWAGASLGELPASTRDRGADGLAGHVLACLQQVGPFESPDETARPIQLVRSEAVARDGMQGWRRAVVLGNTHPQFYDGWAVDVSVVRAGPDRPWVVLTTVAPVGDVAAGASAEVVQRSLRG